MKEFNCYNERWGIKYNENRDFLFLTVINDKQIFYFAIVNATKFQLKPITFKEAKRAFWDDGLEIRMYNDKNEAKRKLTHLWKVLHDKV